MDIATIAAWAGAGGTFIAAGAAIVAAIYTKQAAHEARNAAKAAADQVELQRPRPIVIVFFERCFSDNKGNTAPNDTDFHLQNIGDSPAFDVVVSTLRVPGKLPYLGDEPSQLETRNFAFVTPGTQRVICAHQLSPPRGGMSTKGAAGFVDDATRFFNEKNKSAHPSEMRHEIPFALSYRALDGRQFRQAYVFVIYWLTMTAWVEPVGSLLEAAGQDPI
jgi:hypothetical protein